MQYVPRLEVAEEACRLCLIISTGTRTEQVYFHVFANYNGRYIYTIKTTLLIVIINAYSINESTRNAGDVLRWISDNPEWKLFILGRGNLRGSPRISTWTALAFIIFINDLWPNLKNLSSGFNLSRGLNWLVLLKIVSNVSRFKPVLNLNRVWQI